MKEVSLIVNSTNRMHGKDMHTRYKPLSLGVRVRVDRFGGFIVLRFKFPENWGKKRMAKYLKHQIPWRKLRRIAIGIGVRFLENPLTEPWEEILGVLYCEREVARFTK